MMFKNRFNPGIVLLILCILLSACGPSETEPLSGPKTELMSESKVLISVGDNILAYGINDVKIMLPMLEDAGIQAVIATQSEDSYQGSDQSLMSDILLQDVNVADYDGFLLPCAAGGINELEIQEAVAAMVAEAAAQNKPIAALDLGVVLLDQPGILDGVHYAYRSNEFPQGIYDGKGVVRDGNIITSGCCALSSRGGECVAELTQHLIEAVAP
jgi:putative intracellular protease/amidase